MKGFVRILESIIASIIILTSLTFFLTVSVRTGDWDVALAETRAQDALSAAYINGSLANFVRDNDDTSMRNFMEGLFTKSTDFSVEVIGIPNPTIFVGCSCSDGQADDIKDRLNPLSFVYRSRQIEIRVERVSVPNIPEQTNILLFMAFDDMNNVYSTPNGKNSIERFIESGGTVFLISDLTEAQANSNSMKSVFNATWNSDSGLGPSAKFNDPSDPGRITFNIAKYYQNLTGNDPENENFNGFNTNGDLINKISRDNSTIVQTNNRKFSFVKGNRNIINGNGRAAWMAENSRSGQLNNLTKAAVMWASGEKYSMDGDVKKLQPLESRRAGILVHDVDNYELRITTWNVF